MDRSSSLTKITYSVVVNRSLTFFHTKSLLMLHGCIDCVWSNDVSSSQCVAHFHLILQLSQELGPQWMKYDIDYCQWAAARNVCQWGELDFSIYGHCLSAQQHLASSSSHPCSTPAPGNRKTANPSSKEACFWWSFHRQCGRANFPYSHSCWLCGGAHPVHYCTEVFKIKNKWTD